MPSRLVARLASRWYPYYRTWAALPFLAGVAYERLVNSIELLNDFRVNILASMGGRLGDRQESMSGPGARSPG
jgi:hypothetical protein